MVSLLDMNLERLSLSVCLIILNYRLNVSFEHLFFRYLGVQLDKTLIDDTALLLPREEEEAKGRRTGQEYYVIVTVGDLERALALSHSHLRPPPLDSGHRQITFIYAIFSVLMLTVALSSRA